MQLTGNPYRQTEWTTWLEYLSYEERWLSELTNILESKEPQYYQSWTTLLRAMQKSSSHNTAASTQDQQCSSSVKNNTGATLQAVQADRDASYQLMGDFIGETKPYLNIQKAIFYQKRRVQWIVQEAQFMQATRNFGTGTGESKKRRHSDKAAPQSQSKRTRRR